jgi:hypothetical protein
MHAPVTDTIKPFVDSDIEVRRRWYPVADGAELLDAPTVFWSAKWEPFPYLPRTAGPVYAGEVSFPRVGTPRGLPNDHVCDLADIETGGHFDPDVFVVYDSEWIPDCCGASDMCTTQLCSQDQVNARPAAQLRSYPIPHQDATGTTPMYMSQWAANQGNNVPAYPGTLDVWLPAGEDNPAGWSLEEVADDSGVPVFREETFRRAADEAITERKDSTGWTLAIEKGGDSGTLTARINGDGVLELCGVNAVICADLMPAGVSFRSGAPLIGNGDEQAGATPIPPGAHVLDNDPPDGYAFVLQAVEAAEVDVYPSSFTGHRVFPPPGESFVGMATDDPLEISFPLSGPVMYRLLRLKPVAGAALWSATAYRITGELPPVGTVTSVDIGTSSLGLSVGGGPVTNTGTLTVDLHADLEQLVGFPAADAILAGDGAGNWTPVAIGDWLNFAGGVLDVVPPTGDNQQVVGTTFSITAASGTYQATGTTIALATAGTYLITGKIRGTVLPGASTSHFITAKLRDTTNGADITDSETVICYSDASGQAGVATAGFTVRVIAAGAVTLEVYAFRSGTTFTLSDVNVSDANGRTVFNVTRLE